MIAPVAAYFSFPNLAPLFFGSSLRIGVQFFLYYQLEFGKGQLQDLDRLCSCGVIRGRSSANRDRRKISLILRVVAPAFREQRIGSPLRNQSQQLPPAKQWSWSHPNYLFC
jgi:hypothetical protein